jgi:hypothetical protein
MRRRTAAVALLATILALPTTAPVPASAAPASGRVAGTPRTVVTAGTTPAAASPSRVPTRSWCRTVLPPPKGTAKRAARILAGRVDLGIYGWFPPASPPSWQPAATLDRSGNTHMHGLHWAIPLLYHGAATGDRALVDRFYGILSSWWAAFPPELPRSSAQDQSLVAGQRLWTLTCASEMAAASGQDPSYWAGVARIEAQRALDRFAVVAGTNNTALYAQSAALAASCQAADPAGSARALANLSTLADHLVRSDGSDLEGSPHYALHTLQLLAKANRLADRCGLPHPQLDAALARGQEFLAFATRPDGVLETLGDSPGSRPTTDVLAPKGPATFAATSGARGRRPAARYRVFEGGYAFGRSTWGRRGGSLKDTTSATWYSVRTGRGPAPTAHTHDDIGAVTIMARGVRWIGDPGPWRYDGSDLRRAVVARQAHAALAVIPLPPPSPPLPPPDVLPVDPGVVPPPPPWTPPTPKPDSRLTASSSDARSDLTCVEDLTYPTAALTRCVTLQRRTRTVVVEDVITAREASRIQGRWQLPPGVRLTQRGTAITLRSGGKRATLTLGGTQVGSLSTSRTWFTKSYGVKALGRTLLREIDLAPGQSVTWRMEFRAK